MDCVKKILKNSEGLKAFGGYLQGVLMWIVLGLLVGAVGGVVGAAFAKSIVYVTSLRAKYNWLLLMLPIGGLAITAIYKLCKMNGVGTNDVLESVRTGKKVPYLLSVSVFCGTVLTHLFGGSAGREGAALQLGGSVTSLIGSAFKLDKPKRKILTMCGMGAFFSALFGTPIGAFVFAIEVINVGFFCTAALLPAAVSSVSAYGVSVVLGVSPEQFEFEATAPEVFTMLKVLVIAAVGAIVSIVFCRTLHFSEKLFKKALPDPFLRSFAGGMLLVAMSFIVNTSDYNGGGIDVIERIFVDGTVNYEAFLLKMIFTAVTVGVGFKGGEIVPTFFIGATLGGSLAYLLGMAPSLGAAVGMAALFSGVTNCPLATVMLSAELFGGEGFLYCAVAAVVGYLLSGSDSIYAGQIQAYHKLSENV